MKIHFFQHVSFESPGYILTWAKDKSHQVSFTRFYETVFRLPDIDSFDALIIMGGPMAANDEEKHPWLAAEKEFIQTAIGHGKKVLGICLGAQLIAASLGAKVGRATYKEIGWFPVSPTAAGQLIPWFYELFMFDPIVFHWHGDQFDIPRGGLSLARSEANINQAFIYNNSVLGLQFHLEVSRDDIIDMIQHGWADLDDAPYIQTMAQQIKGSKHVRAGKRIMYGLLDHFFSLS